MKWYETDRFILVCFLLVLCEAAVGWVVWKYLWPGENSDLPRVDSIEQVVLQPLLEEDARRAQRAQAEAWCRASGFHPAGMTVLGFWAAVWATEIQGTDGRWI
jgi:hypothetical protein